MFTCLICHFETELDDVIAPPRKRDGGCICLRCWEREADAGLRFPTLLRREIQALTRAA